MVDYGLPEYWDKRYNENKNSIFDWLEDYKTLRPIIR